MPIKKDIYVTGGEKLLSLFRKLMIDGRKHFQADLAEGLQSSAQTIIHLACKSENVIGIGLESGIENRKTWYQIKSIYHSRLGVKLEELHYPNICQDLADAILPSPVLKRIDDTLFSLSMLIADQNYARRDKAQEKQFTFFSKCKIDYAPHLTNVNALSQSVKNKQICFVSYKASGKDKIKEHPLAPSKIITMNNALYAIGVILLDSFVQVKHFIDFAIHRISEVILLERTLNIDLPIVEANTLGVPLHEYNSFSIHFMAGKPLIMCVNTYRQMNNTLKI